MNLIKKLAMAGLVPALTLTVVSTSPVAKAQTSADTGAVAEPYSPEREYDEYMRLGFAAQQAGDYAIAANYFRYALYAVPNDREAITAYWNARSELQSTDLSGRAAIYEQNMEQGYDATDAGDYEVALEHFLMALQQRPDDYYATQAIRNVYTYLNRGVGASSPSDVPATYNVYAGETPYDRYMRLGYAAAQREDFTNAKTYFRSALYERPNDRQATLAYWNAVDGIQDGDFGLDATTESAYDRYMRLGYDATERGNYAQAINFFENALTERPEDGYATQAIRNVQTYMSN
ncbi:MAG: hypothetical protein AAF152_12370 [Cyanobacteria bacterium P01_A01_bin.114]